MSSKAAARAAARSETSKSEPGAPATGNDVDTSVLDKLIDITRQQRQLQDFRTRADEKKGKVDPAVYRRVVEDYNKRHAALDNQARPLKVQARQEFEKLRAIFDTVNGRDESARYDKQELEFRHDVGEMDAGELAERLKAPEAILEECRVELVALGEQKARFLEAFDEEELARPTRDVPPSDPVDAAPPPAVEPEPGDTNVPPEEDDPGATRPGPASHPSATVAGSATGTGDQTGEPTFVLPEAMLVGSDSDGGPEVEYQLSAINYIGRSEDNQIRILRAGVSRRHAVIVAEQTAFIIRDLRSQNGTFVNDAQIQECTLVDGDKIRLGEAQLVFRTPNTNDVR